MKWFPQGAAAGCIALHLAGCAGPAESVANRVAALGYPQSTVTGTSFRHLTVRAGSPAKHGAIHVYVDHDGLPWDGPESVSSDPTPRFPLALELMARDDGERIYLGRPCYFGLQGDPGCSPRLWTDARYSDAVVQSMAAVVNRLVEERAPRAGVVLIGYSGGGTIAWLMAAHVPATTAVVTIAANLDVRSWTTLHHYTPLAGSLDPAAAMPLPQRIRQVHFVGGRDTNVPPALVRPVALRQPGGQVVEIADFDHVCCWLERWPALLREVAGGAPYR
jgi:pimeloyl-ACP methyl ester carboxylesterase